VKSTKQQAKDKERREKHTPNIVYSVWSNLTYSWGEIDLSNPLSKSSYKEIQIGYKKLSFNKLTKNKLNFYPFFQSHQCTRHSMIFIQPRCLQCFPTQENFNRRPSTLELPPLIYQVFLS